MVSGRIGSSSSSTHFATAAAASAADVDATTTPPYLRGLATVNPNLLRDYAADPGLRAFLDANRSSLVQWTTPPPGNVADKLNWETWCHTTNIVPAKVRDEEYIVVVARGSAYANNGRLRLPLHDGGEASSSGRIVWVGKTKDLLSTQKKADENGHYPGAITVDVTVPLAGKPGEKVELCYARVSPDNQGRMHRSHSGWPDSFQGVSGGYSGRELSVTLAGGRTQQVDSPDGCSTRSVARLL
jgi:hypothetical protein